MGRTSFNGLRLIWWLSLVIKFDPALFEKPPKLVKSQDIKERLKHSTVTSDEINNVHFTSRGKVVGSSGKCRSYFIRNNHCHFLLHRNGSSCYELECIECDTKYPDSVSHTPTYAWKDKTDFA